MQQKKVNRKGSGKVIDERRSNEAEPLMQLYEKLAEKTGQDIVLKDKDMEGINGEFNRSMSTIVFNMDAENKYTTIFHEALGEFSESWAPEQMAEFQNDLLEWYFNEYSDTEMNQIIGKYQEVYAEKEGAKSYREAANELVNDALAGLFTTDTGMEDFTNWLYENKPQKEAKSVVQKIADLIKELCDKIRTYLKDTDIGTAAKKALRMEADRAAGLRMRLLEIADEAAENYKKAGVGEKDTEESRYSLSEEVLKKLGKYDKDNYQAFQKEINNYLNGNFDASNSLMVMNSTPQILQQVGLENKRILMTARHFNDITHKESSKNPHWHGLTVQEVMEAPVLLNHPVIVADSLTRNDSVVVISESLDNKGRPIIIAMKTNGKGALDYQIVDSNFMTSMYGKDGFSNFVSKLISKNKILYINKEKSHGLYKNLRLQLPSTLVNLGFDKSIQQSKNVVNKNASETKNETKKFSLEVPLDNYEIVDDDVQMLRSVGRKSINEFTSEDIQKSQKWAYKFYQELGTKSPFFRTWFGDWRAYDTKLTEIVKISNDGGKNPRGSYKNADTGWNIVSSSVGYDETISHSGRDKMSVRALENIDKIIEKSVLLDTEVSEYGRGKKSSGTAFIHKFYAIINVDGTPYIAKMAVDESYQSKQDTYKKFYHVRAIKMTPAFSVGTGFNQIAHLLNTGVNISISDLHNFVKQYDKDFQPKSVNVDLLSGDGTPKVLYHGTNADFTEFDISKNKTITFGKGFYFGENKDAVSQYYAGENGKVMEAYLNMKKPFVIETSQLKDIDAVPAVVGNYFGEVNVTKGNIRDILKSHGYDGIHYKNTKTKGNDVWVAYDSGQIKSATDNIGTFDGKNPDVRYSLSGTTNLDAYWENYDGFDEVFGSSASILEEGALAMQGKEVDRDTVKKLARKMKQEYRSNIDLDTFTDNLVKVFSYMQTQKKANYEDMLRVMNEIAMPVIEESMGYDATEVQQYKEMKQKLRGYKLKLTEEQKQEVGYYYGNYEVFRRSCFGTLNFTDNGTYLDSVWSELVELTGGFLEYGINDKDQAIMLKYAIDAMKPQLRNNFGADNHGVAMDLSLRIYEEYFKAQEGAKAEKLRKAMVHERVEFHDKLRKQYYEKLAAERKRMKEKTGTIAQRVAEVKAANTQSQLEKVNRQRAAQYRNEIKRTGGELIRWIETPTDKKHVPEALKKATLEFLSAIDFISHRALDDSDSTRRWQEKMGAVARQLQMAEQSELSDEYGNFIIDLDPDFVPMLETFLRKNDGVEKISQMEYDQLENLNTLMTTLKRTIAKANELHRNDRYKYVAEVANGTIVELQKKKSRKSHAKAVDMASNLLNFDMLDSFTYFETLGGAATSIHKEIREGFNTRTWHLKEAQEYMQELLKGKKIKDWTGDKAQVHEFNTRDGKLKLSTGQIMSLYLLGKRSQGMQHILSGGIRAAQTGRGKKQIWQVKPQHVTKGLYQEMIGVLTEEQMDVADKMQKFLAKNCAEWGNHTSMTLYNYKKFMDERYFPIKTYDNSRMTNDKNTSDTASLYAIKNQGMTKNLVPEARNALVVEDIMDVFTNHVTAMANYDAFAVPLSDAMKWFNYKNEGMVGEQLESDSVKEELERVYGRKAKDYFIQFMKDINGEAGNGSSEKISEAFISRYKAAAVGANVRVAIQQPTAYMRAALLLNPIDMMRGMAGMPNVKRAKEYSAIALWKSWGYYETSIGQSMKQVITGQSTLSDNIRDKASILAALGDEVTWGYLWNACENEIRRTRKDIKPDTEEFYRKVAERFDDVIDQTQVVDTVLHRSQFMKDKDNLRKLEAAFMSEPTKSYNMLYRGIKKGKKELAKAVLVYGMTGVLTSLAAAVMDAVRDDDREKTFREKYLESVKGNLLDNVNILGTIPYIKDVFYFVNGYEAERMDMAGIANLISSMQMIYKYVFDDSKKTTYGVVKSAARAVSQVSGIPFYNLLREVESLAENITGENWLTNKESNTELYRKLIQYGEEGNEEKYQKTMDKLLENGIEQEKINKKVISEAKKQFKEGELSRAETEDILKEYGMEADDIYWALNKAEEGDDYNKYNELYEAVESGKGLKSAIRELTGHGVKEKTIGSRITAQYKEQYVKLYRTNKTKAAALKARLLNAYVQLGFDREKRSKAIDNWIE